MKQFKFVLLLLAAFSILSTSCEPISQTKYVQKNKVLVLNQGNYKSQDGSVYVYDEDTKIMTPNAYAKANNNARLGATLMSGTYSSYGIGYLLCSNPDKIEVINVLTMQTLSNPIEQNLLNTREIALGTEHIFVSNAGTDYVELADGSWEYINSYVSVYNQSNNNAVDTIHVGSDAQGMIYYNNALYVGTKAGIVKLEKNGDKYVKESTYTDEEYPGAVKYFAYYNNLLYASIPGYGIIAYDPNDEKVRERYPVAECLDSNGYITMDTEGNIYTFATKYTADWSDVESSCVYRLNTKTGETVKLFDGEYLYSVGISPYSGNVFTSEANGFMSNSTVNIFNPKTETSVDNKTAGIGTFRYLFFSYYEEDTNSTEEK